MTKILSITGHSGSGKTTLIEELIPELRTRGYRIGTVKHAHQGFHLDRRGKDSWRHKAAGAETVVVASPGEIALFKAMDGDGLAGLMPFFSDMDLVLAEGYKNEKQLKIEVFRQAVHSVPIHADDESLLAFVTDTRLDTNRPQFSPSQVREIVDFIETRILERDF
jgi:molybdopterin-guanine dinucleotide biosynthesis adapter protein